MADKRTQVRTAAQLVSQGKYEQALEIYQQILDDKPGETAILNDVGDLYVRLGRGQEAIPYFRRAAKSFEKNGFRKKAIATLRKAHRQNPTDQEIVEYLAGLHVQEGLIGEARSLMMELARHHHALGHTKEARDAYEKVVEIDPKFLPALLKVSELAALEGDIDAEFKAYLAVGRELAARGSWKKP